ncbi:MAG: hypothetical protein AB7U83_00775 [Vicinamibacterales bacterium]
MSTFLKLAFTALVLNACVQFGRSAWTFYQFEDSVQQAALFSASQSPTQLKGRISQLIGQHQVPMDPETVEVSYASTQARITGAYTDKVSVVPGVYVYDWTHALDLDVRRTPY